MIDSIAGRLKRKDTSGVVVEVGGVSFRLIVTLSTLDKLPRLGINLELFTHLHVREDVLELYGFYTEEERTLFIMLLGVTKIGPKMAMGILSGTNPEEFKRRIVTTDVEALATLPGIGVKTAKRLVIELKDKLVTEKDMEELGVPGEVPMEFSSALNALTSLGLTRSEAFRKLSDMKRSGELAGSLEQIIKVALTKS